MRIHPQSINDLKAAGYYFTAGALARQMGHGKEFGCHFGMKSELDHARAQFERGWNAAG